MSAPGEADQRAVFAFVDKLRDGANGLSATLNADLAEFTAAAGLMPEQDRAEVLTRLLVALNARKDRKLELHVVRRLLSSRIFESDDSRRLLCKQAANAAHVLGYLNEASGHVATLTALRHPVSGPQIEKTREELRAFHAVKEELGRAPPARVSRASTGYNLLYVAHNCRPFASGGYAVRSHNIVKSLSRAGARGAPCEVIALARLGFPYDAKLDTLEELPAVAFSRDVEGVTYHFSAPSLRTGRLYSYFPEASAHVSAAIDRHQTDIVQAATNFYTAFPAYLSARRAGLPFVYEVRSFWGLTRASRDPSFLDEWQYRRDDLLEKILYLSADRVVTLTEAMKDAVVATGVRSDRISVVPNCVDTSAFQPRDRDKEIADSLGIGEDEIVIGYVGSFLEYEGLSLLLEAFARIARSETKTRLLLVGDDNPSGAKRDRPMLDSLRRQAAELHCAEAVTFTGRVPHDEVARYYSLIDIAPFPRRSFPITELVSPLKPLEALAMGKCVLISDVGGMKGQIIDGETGLVFGADVGALEAKLRMLLQDEDLRRRLAANGRTWVMRERNWDRAAEGLRSLYGDARELPRPIEPGSDRARLIAQHLGDLSAGPSMIEVDR